jgi:hypothetical protein
LAEQAREHPEDQWCYEIKDQVLKMKEHCLSLTTGYRLPTEAEMKYAMRAVALTSRHYGETEDLLAKYAWYRKNSRELTWPVGSLKPDDPGLFDVYGNACWCKERCEDYPRTGVAEVSDEQEDELDVPNGVNRVQRVAIPKRPRAPVAPRYAGRTCLACTFRQSGSVWGGRLLLDPVGVAVHRPWSRAYCGGKLSNRPLRSPGLSAVRAPRPSS